VLLIGDGSAQLTIAELGTLIRNNVNALVVLVNNDGYTVERAIHGADCRYNDIARWDWTALPGALAKDRPSFTARATTPAELRDALSTAARKTDRLSLIEVVVPRMDVPPLLVRLAEAAAAANRPRVPAAVTAATTAE
jgi:indolepyruvate decarboxylase